MSVPPFPGDEERFFPPEPKREPPRPPQRTRVRPGTRQRYSILDCDVPLMLALRWSLIVGIASLGAWLLFFLVGYAIAQSTFSLFGS